MKQRIKALYLLTIAGIVAFCLLEGYWLRLRFAEAVREQEKVEFERVTESLDRYFSSQRERLPQQSFNFSLRYELTAGGARQSVEIIEADSVARERLEKMSDEEKRALQTADSLPEGFRRHRFEVLENPKADVQELISRFVVLRATGLDADSLRRICCVEEARFVTGKERVYEASRESLGSLFCPKLRIVYPLSTLEKKTAELTADVPFDAAVKEMAVTLAVSFIVALLLVFCLVYQMATIRRQQRIAELQKSFTLTMLHELKRPLGALKLFVSFMKSGKMGAADREEALRNASREIENLSSYFNKLRAITYNEASEVPLSLSSFNLKEAVEESAAMISGACVSLQGGEDVEIVAERQSIVNVMCNLIENAVKYSPENEEISVAWKVFDGRLEISVADRGRGIPDADKPLIFDQFYRAGKSADIPGMGLGLAYVRQVVEAHGGTIAVKDRDGGGTVFTIQLPQ